MQATINSVLLSTRAISEFDAQRVANQYVATTVDPTFAVVGGTRYYYKPLEREVWQFIIRCTQSPLDAIYVDAQTGEVIPLVEDQVRMVRERAAIAEAKTRDVLPVDEHGYVPAEYARRKANGYLSREVSLFCSATDGVFIPLAHPIWQFAIRFGLPRLGELGILGTFDVDAHSGKVIPLTNQQIKRMRVRANAIVEFQTQTAAV